MAILIESHADELMRRDVVIEILRDLIAKSVPVSLSILKNDGGSGIATSVHCVPEWLAFSISNVFGTTRDTNDIDGAAVLLICVDSFKLTIPAHLVVERFELNVVQGSCARLDSFLAVEDWEHIVTFLNISLIRSDTNKSIHRDALILDELLTRPDIGLRVTISENLDVDVSRGSVTASCYHSK